MMIALIGAAMVAAQPAPVAHPPAKPATMSHEQHQAMKEKCCCCEHMMKGGHGKRAPSERPHEHPSQ